MVISLVVTIGLDLGVQHFGDMGTFEVLMYWSWRGFQQLKWARSDRLCRTSYWRSIATLALLAFVSEIHRYFPDSVGNLMVRDAQFDAILLSPVKCTISVLKSTRTRREKVICQRSDIIQLLLTNVFVSSIIDW